MRTKRENTFGYWFAFLKSYSTTFTLGTGKKTYKFIDSVEEYFNGNHHDSATVIVVREIGSHNYTALKYNDIKDKQINIIN